MDPAAWYYGAVAYACQSGLMQGTGRSAFSPKAVTTRGQVVTMLYRLEGSPAAGVPVFDDLSGSYCAGAAAWAAECGLSNGYGNGRFGPDDPVTREQLAVLLCRYAQYKGLDVTPGGLSFPDGDQISTFALQSLGWAVRQGILSGYDSGLLGPKDTASRAQTAAIFQQFCPLLTEQAP